MDSLSAEDIFYMEQAHDEAEKGLGRTSPNPPVGAVLVKQGRIIGRGFHQKAGQPHAEVNAIADAGPAASGSTIYVTLEPCNHTGKTPPCTHAIIAAKIKRVVVGALDPNHRVAGGGCDYLKSHGIKVSSGVLEKKCLALIRFFIKHNRTGLPWVAMKAGMSLDGKISYTHGAGGRITGAASGAYTHTLRDRYDAILIGCKTAIIDNPSLTTRLPAGGGRDPLRVILDSELRLSSEAKLLNIQSNAPTWIYCGNQASEEKRLELEENRKVVVHRVAESNNGQGLSLSDIFTHLGSQNICSVLVEGGATIHGALVKEALVDQAYLFYAPIIIGEAGVPVVNGWSAGSAFGALRLTDHSVLQLGDDVLIDGYFH